MKDRKSLIGNTFLLGLPIQHFKLDPSMDNQTNYTEAVCGEMQNYDAMNTSSGRFAGRYDGCTS